MNGAALVFSLLVIGGLTTALVRVADAELTAWLDERRFLRREPAVVELPPAVTGLRPAPVVYDQDHDGDDVVAAPSPVGQFGGAA